MSERFLVDVVREAPPPRRRPQPWWYRPGLGLIAAISVVCGLVAAYDGMRFTAGGFVAAGVLIWIVFKDAEG